MSDLTFKIAFADKSELTGLTINGNTFVTLSPIDKTYFTEEKLAKIIVEQETETDQPLGFINSMLGTFTDQTLAYFEHFSTDEEPELVEQWRFMFANKPVPVPNLTDMQATVNNLSSKVTSLESTMRELSTTIEWPKWSKPSSATDAYATGDKVTHNGEKYISGIDGNVFEPGTTNSHWTEHAE